MLKSIEHIILSALLHDICKVYEDYKYIENNGHFCDILKNKFPVLNIDKNNNDSDNWYNLTKFYYKSDNNKQSLSYRIINAADFFASAEREEGFDSIETTEKEKQNISLIPILERVDLNNKNHPTFYELPRTKLSFNSKNLFPVKKEHGQKEKISINDLVNDIYSIPDFKNNNDSTHLRCIISFLLSIFEKYLSQIPANINTKTPDVSLFDHLRVTAAIAEGLYEYHKDKKDLDENQDFKKDLNNEKWILVCGDFAGIQNFIYKLTSKKAAKGLRGRSLYIQLLCDISAQYIIKIINIFPTSLIYSSGGKFYILIPNTDKHISLLEKAANTINSWLLKEFRGEMYLGIGKTKVSGEYFEAGAMGIKWKEANEDLQKNRLQRFSYQIMNNPDFFEPQDLHKGNKVCQACSRNDSNADIQLVDDIQKCRHCRSLEEIGYWLTSTKYLLWVWNQSAGTDIEKKHNFIFKSESDTMTCQLYFCKKRPDNKTLEQLNDYSLEIINEPEKPDEFGLRFIGKWNSNKSKVTEFHEFADNSVGINRLGILRMDVDNLGEIFVRGFDFLADYDKKDIEMGSLSRIATMSRQLNLFFSGYLNVIIQEFNKNSFHEKAQIIYSGGDDLFIIGSWNIMPEIARKIQKYFTHYCCRNKYFTLSAGISMVTGKYPIYNAAMIAGKDESNAKNIGEIVDTSKNQHDTEHLNKKNALCFMGTVVGWEDFDIVLSLKNTIQTIIDKTKSRSIIDKLNTVIFSVHMFEQSKKADMSLKKIYELVYFQKWRWQLIYNLHRMASKYPDIIIKNYIQTIQYDILNNDHNKRLPVLSWLEMPVRWADFLTRKE